MTSDKSNPDRPLTGTRLPVGGDWARVPVPYMEDPLGCGFQVILALMFVFLLIVIGIYDLLIILGANDAETVSEIIWRWGQANPIVTVTIGILIGHLFFPMRPRGRL